MTNNQVSVKNKKGDGILPTIPQDTIIEILIRCRLPPKFVVQLRCASNKEWSSSLSDHFFIQKHLKTLNRIHFIFESKEGFLYSVLYIDHKALSARTKLSHPIDCIFGSVNGLVLASACQGQYILLVFSPTTKNYVELPDSNAFVIFTHVMIGFGYDSKTDNYKVVAINSRSYHVYDLKGKKWNKRDFPYVGNYGGRAGVFVKGFLHWICDSRSTEKPVIVAFSLEKENFSEVPRPPNLSDELLCVNTKLVALDEKLVIFNEEKGDVWLMNEYGVEKSWTKIEVHGYNNIPMVEPMVFFDEGKFVFLTKNLMRTYDVKEGTFCGEVDLSRLNIKNFKNAYAESLVSLKFSKSS